MKPKIYPTEVIDKHNVSVVVGIFEKVCVITAFKAGYKYCSSLVAVNRPTRYCYVAHLDLVNKTVRLDYNTVKGYTYTDEQMVDIKNRIETALFKDPNFPVILFIREPFKRMISGFLQVMMNHYHKIYAFNGKGQNIYDNDAIKFFLENNTELYTQDPNVYDDPHISHLCKSVFDVTTTLIQKKYKIRNSLYIVNLDGEESKKLEVFKKFDLLHEDRKTYEISSKSNSTNHSPLVQFYYKNVKTNTYVKTLNNVLKLERGSYALLHLLYKDIIVN